MVCMGGDGTLLYANTLFPFSSPPIISFGMGSLGFVSALISPYLSPYLFLFPLFFPSIRTKLTRSS